MPRHEATRLSELEEQVDTLEAVQLTLLQRIADLETHVFGTTRFPLSAKEVLEAIMTDADRTGRRRPHR